MPKLPFYLNLSKILSYNCPVMAIIGLRGWGKTYAVKCYCITQFLRKGTTAMWSRQTDTQLDLQYKTFLNDLKANDEFGDELYRFYIKGKILWYRPKDGGEHQPVIYFDALSKNVVTKGLSDAHCRIFVLDEALNENGEYLTNEFVKFSSLITTALRLRSGQVFLLSNSVSVDNPYFKYFNIKLPKDGKNFSKSVFHFGEGKILPVVAQFGDDKKEYQKASKDSLAGMIASLSDYGESSVKNKFFFDDNTAVIDKRDIKGERLVCAYNIYVEGEYLGIYKLRKHNIILVSNANPQKKTFVFKDYNKVLEKNHILLSRNNGITNYLLNYYVNGFFVFDSIEKKNKFIDFLNMVR